MSTTNYIPGTKLSYANGTECCTVLTNGNALVTKVWGDRWWEQMPLADWLILAEGQEEEDFIPISKAEEEYDDMPGLISLNTPSAQEVNAFWDNLVQRTADVDRAFRPTKKARATPTKQAPAIPSKVPIGTKFKWTSAEDDETYRVAVKTKDGICQVKAVTEGGGDCYFDPKTKKRYLTKRTFDCEASWLDSLPEGGEVAVY